jgi:hypothetical protein
VVDRPTEVLLGPVGQNCLSCVLKRTHNKVFLCHVSQPGAPQIKFFYDCT